MRSIVTPYVSIIDIGEEEYQHAVEVILKYGLKPSDALHLGAMMSNNITLVASEDKDLDRVKEIRRLWLD